MVRGPMVRQPYAIAQLRRFERVLFEIATDATRRYSLSCRVIPR